MNPSVISPVVPSLPARSGGQLAPADSVIPLVRRPLPLPSLISGRTSTVVYGLAALDARGRIADTAVLHALDWRAGLRLGIAETSGVLTVHADPAGDHQVTGQGHLRLPAPLRHRLRLTSGDRVLLAADPDQARLTIYPPAALDKALALLADPTGGEPT